MYRETANYAYEAGELESYRASLAANVECRKAIEAAISSNYGDNRLDADAAVKSVLEPVSYTHLDVYKRQLYAHYQTGTATLAG